MKDNIFISSKIYFRVNVMWWLVHWQASFLVPLNLDFENCRGRKGIFKNYLEKDEKNGMKIRKQGGKSQTMDCIKLWKAAMNLHVGQMKERTGALEIKKGVCFTTDLISGTSGTED